MAENSEIKVKSLQKAIDSARSQTGRQNLADDGLRQKNLPRQISLSQF